MNLIQNSALSLSLCMDATRYLGEVIDRLREYGFHARYNDGMELLTIRGFTPASLAQYAEGEDVYLSQRTRRNIRIVRRAVG